MTFSFSEVQLYFKNSVVESEFIRSISTNPFCASLVIVLVLMLVVLIVFRNSKLPAGDSLWSLILRTGIYSFVSVLIIMYSHNYYMNKQYGGKEIDAPNISGLITEDDFTYKSDDEKPEIKNDNDGLPTFL